MNHDSVTWAGVVDTFLLLLVGIGPKLAVLPFIKITAPLERELRARVRNKMIATAAVAALVLVVLGELLSRLLHFTIGSLTIGGGVILLVLAVRMVLGEAGGDAQLTEAGDPMKLAMVPLAVPYLLNPVGIVGLITISAESNSITVVAVEIAILAVVLLIDYLVFLWLDRASRGVSEERMLVVEKVFGFLIAAIAVQLLIDGLSSAKVITG